MYTLFAARICLSGYLREDDVAAAAAPRRENPTRSCDRRSDTAIRIVVSALSRPVTVYHSRARAFVDFLSFNVATNGIRSASVVIHRQRVTVVLFLNLQTAHAESRIINVNPEHTEGLRQTPQVVHVSLESERFLFHEFFHAIVVAFTLPQVHVPQQRPGRRT